MSIFGWNTNADVLKRLDEIHEDILKKLYAVRNSINENTIAVGIVLDKRLRAIQFQIKRPEKFKVNLISQEEIVMGLVTKKLFTYEVSLQEVPADNDAIHQHLTITGLCIDAVNNNATADYKYDRGAVIERFKVIDGYECSLSLAYEDELGNKTADPKVLSFVAIDQIAPEVPDGAMILKQVDQESITIDDGIEEPMQSPPVPEVEPTDPVDTEEDSEVEPTDPVE